MDPDEARGDRAALEYLLNGRPMRRRREEFRNREERERWEEKPVRVDELGPFELLVWEYSRGRIKRRALFDFSLDWATLCDLREARAWLEVGARVNDLETVRKFRDVGVPPRVAGQPTLALGRETYLDLVRKGILSAAQVRDMAVRRGWLHPGDGGNPTGHASS